MFALSRDMRVPIFFSVYAIISIILIWSFFLKKSLSSTTRSGGDAPTIEQTVHTPQAFPWCWPWGWYSRLKIFLVICISEIASTSNRARCQANSNYALQGMWGTFTPSEQMISTFWSARKCLGSTPQILRHLSSAVAAPIRTLFAQRFDEARQILTVWEWTTRKTWVCRMILVEAVEVDEVVDFLRVSSRKWPQFHNQKKHLVPNLLQLEIYSVSIRTWQKWLCKNHVT